MPALSKRAQRDFGGPLAPAKNEAMEGDAERAVIGASGQDVAGEGDGGGERQLPRCLRLGNREQMGCEPARPRDRGRLDPAPAEAEMETGIGALDRAERGEAGAQLPPRRQPLPPVPDQGGAGVMPGSRRTG